jgi:hypothetical protein
MLSNSLSNPLLQEFSLDDIEALAQENPSLRGYLQGYLAELKLRQLLLAYADVSSVEKIPDSSSTKGDFLVTYKGVTLTVESKSFRSNTARYNPLSESWAASVQCKNPGSRVLTFEGRGSVMATCVEEMRFDVLAICTFPVTGQWGFLFCPEFFLPRAENKPGYLQSSFLVDTDYSPGVYKDPLPAFDMALGLGLESDAKIGYLISPYE